MSNFLPSNLSKRTELQKGVLDILLDDESVPASNRILHQLQNLAPGARQTYTVAAVGVFSWLTDPKVSAAFASFS